MTITRTLVDEDGGGNEGEGGGCARRGREQGDAGSGRTVKRKLPSVRLKTKEVEQQLPGMIGVSKAILDSVIFVHQEDSNWPLGESATLKKRFDDMFAAARYTKAMETMRGIAKAQTKETDTYRAKLEALGAHRKYANGLRQKISEEERKVDEYRRCIAEGEEELDGLRRDVGRIQDKLDALQEKEAELKTSRALLSAAKRSAADSTASLDRDKDEDTEDLVDEARAELDRGGGVASAMAAMRRRRDEIQKDIDGASMEREEEQRAVGTLEKEISDLKDEHAHATVRQGKLETERDAHERKLAEHSDLCAEICAACEQPDVSQVIGRTASELGALMADDRSRFMPYLESLVGEAEAKCSQMRSRALREAEKHVKVVDECSTNIARLEGEIDGKKAAIQRVEDDMSTASNALGNLGELEADFSERQRRHYEAVASENKLRKLIAGRDDEHTISSLGKKIMELQGQVSKSESRGSGVALRNKLEQRMETLRELDEQLRSKIDAFNRGASSDGDAAGTLGSPSYELRAENATDDFNAFISRLKSHKERHTSPLVARLEDEATRAEEALSKAKAEKHAARAELDLVLKEMESHGPDTRGGGQSSASAALELKHRSLRDKQGKLQDARTRQEIYLHYVDTVDRSHKCAACERSFCASSGEAEVNHEAIRAFRERHIDVLIPRQEEVIRNLESELASLQEEVDTLRIAAIQEDMSDQQRARSAKLRADLGAIEATMLGLQSGADTAAAQLLRARERNSLLSDVIDYDAVKIGDAMTDAREIESDLRAVESTGTTCTDVAAEAGDANGGAAATPKRSFQELVEEIARLTKEREEVFADKAERDESLKRAESKTAGEEERMREAETRLEEARSASKEVDRLKALQESLLQEISSKVEEKKNLESTRAESEELRDRMKEESDDELKRHNEAIRRLQRFLDLLRSIENSIASNESKGFDAALLDCAEEISGLQDRLEGRLMELESSRALLEDKMEHCERQRRRREMVERVIKYLEAVDHLRTAEERVNSIEVEIDPDEYAHLHARHEKLSRQQSRIQRKNYEMQGSISTCEANKKQDEEALASNEYDGIDRRYDQQLVQLKTTEMACIDLNQYHIALDKALQAFHNEKMTQINRIIKELWQRVYRNSDIDYIRIVSDDEKAPASTSGTSTRVLRSYNYRVVMKVGDAELDMRGRCSAGQKVLACLIIRLALAETFCLNCGMLALDEPSTNLDKNNSVSLAQALSSLMTSRYHQQNFQLIIITHDEDFALTIGQKQLCDTYWRIAKDEDGFSRIKEHSMRNHE